MIRARVGIHADINWLLVCSAVLASIGLDTSSTAIVIGPTPPGTGVIQLARSRAASN